jgi:acetyl-CoA C-acetyltransferase
MALDPRTPVLVGVGAVQQREDDPARAAEPFELMARALERAAEDAGSRAVLERADAILTPRGLWNYRDPGRLVTDRLGTSGVRTILSEVGVLQTTLFGLAAQEIAAGRHDVVLVTGGEARHRAQRARRAGSEAPLTAQGNDLVPDRVLRPDGAILSRREIDDGLTPPVNQYAMIENALRRAEGLSLGAHRREVAELWASMSRVAVDNPDAWSRQAVAPESIREAQGRNTMLAFPYTKLHNSQWNVDQAAGLVFCSVETARALGLPRKRWVFPLAVADSNHMLPLSQRRALHRCPGFARAGERILEGSGRSAADIPHLELYSCFPVAVRVQQRELELPVNRTPTVTGGMAFAGGPFNNFVLQALVRMGHVLRDDPGSTGLLTAVSGYLTKQGVSLWSTEPSASGFHFDDVSDATARATEPVEVLAAAEGPARIATYTVLYEGEKPSRLLAICDLPDGRRTLAASPDPALAEAASREEFCGRAVRLAADGHAEIV